MDSFAVVVCRCLVMPGCIVVVRTCGMFHGHGMRPFEEKRANDRGRPYKKTSRKRPFWRR